MYQMPQYLFCMSHRTFQPAVTYMTLAYKTIKFVSVTEENHRKKSGFHISRTAKLVLQMPL